MTYRHAVTVVDGRCLDLLLTEEEISYGFERALHEENQQFIDKDRCCGAWPVNQPPECPFWRRILGICRECDR